MSILTTVSSMQLRLGFDSTNNVNQALTASLISASSYLSQLIRSPFDLLDYTDYFSPRFMIQQGTGSVGRVNLKLKSGFVNTTPTLAYASSMTDLASGASTVLGGAGAGLVIVNSEKGVLSVSDVDLANRYISVHYNAGFNVDTSTPKVYLAVPEWLSEGAITIATTFLDENYPAYRQERNADAQALKRRRQVACQALQRYVRYVPNGVSPLAL